MTNMELVDLGMVRTKQLVAPVGRRPIRPNVGFNHTALLAHPARP
jgi:hypothetical protein